MKGWDNSQRGSIPSNRSEPRINILAIRYFTPSAGFAPHRLRERTFVSSCIGDPAAHTRPDEAALGTLMADDLLLAFVMSAAAHIPEFGIQASSISRPESIPTP